jgi:hypothetical protein
MNVKVVETARNYHQRPGDLISWRPRRGDTFFASPGRRLLAVGHGEVARRLQVQIDGSEVTCHDEIVLVRAKNVAPAR